MKSPCVLFSFIVLVYYDILLFSLRIPWDSVWQTLYIALDEFKSDEDTIALSFCLIG